MRAGTETAVDADAADEEVGGAAERAAAGADAAEGHAAASDAL